MVRRNSVLQQTLVSVIPEMYRNLAEEAQQEPENRHLPHAMRHIPTINLDDDDSSEDDDSPNPPPCRPLIRALPVDQPVEPVSGDARPVVAPRLNNESIRLDEQMARARRRMVEIRNRREHPDYVPRHRSTSVPQLFHVSKSKLGKDGPINTHIVKVEYIESLKDKFSPSQGSKTSDSEMKFKTPVCHIPRTFLEPSS